jgi:hypothetical protein
LALMLSSLLQRKAAQAGIQLTIPALYEQLSDIKEIINARPKTPYFATADVGWGQVSSCALPADSQKS